ncbi:MAG: alpha/beta fold hydrolase [Bacteroidia bacterium]|nr:alpha/beta fold hydrolase [Bacteroidia bacterium]
MDTPVSELKVDLPTWQIVQGDGYRYAFGGRADGPPLVLVHGLFGALSNWDLTLQTFASQYALYVPLLPIYEQSSVDPSLQGLTAYLLRFYEGEGLPPSVWMGNSLGGHLSLLAARTYPQAVRGLVLTGSSGLFEEGMGSSFPRRSSREYVAERVRYTFYDPRHATPELVEEVYTIVNDNYKALRVLKVARDAQRNFVGGWLPEIDVPTCLIWGLNDTITPISVAYTFFRLLPQAELHFIDECGHAPMMEQPERFHAILLRFLQRIFS